MIFRQVPAPAWFRAARSCCCLLALGVAVPASATGLAPDRVAASVGYGDGTAVADIGVVWTNIAVWDVPSRSRTELRLTADLASWQGEDHETNKSLADLSVTPLLRWSPADGPWRSLFVEGGVGIHLLSTTRIGTRDLSTAFQFGERLALGWSFDPANRIEIATYWQHVSNADIKRPNAGLTQYGMMLRVPLD